LDEKKKGTPLNSAEGKGSDDWGGEFRVYNWLEEWFTFSMKERKVTLASRPLKRRNTL